MRKLFTIFLSALCFTFAFFFIACSKSENVIILTDNYYTDYEGVYLTIQSVDYTSEEPTLNIEWHNQTAYEVVYTLPYQIEYKKDEEWINIQTIDFIYDYKEITISPYSTKTQECSTAGFDISKIGTYRLRNYCTILTDEQRPSCTLWTEFPLQNPSQIKKHKLTTELEDWLYGDLKSYYKTGETVVVKIHSAHDVAFSLYMNGKKLQQPPWESGKLYWEYSFTMPDTDVVLTYKVSDGMQLRPILEEVEYLDSIVYRFESSLSPRNGVLYINDIQTDEYALAFDEMRFVEITDIPEVEENLIRYTLGIECVDTVVHLELASAQSFWIESTGKLYEIVNGVDFSAIYEKYAPQEFGRTLLIQTYEENYPLAGKANVIYYYGNYENDTYVAMLTGNNADFDCALWTEQVADYDFLYYNGNRIRVLYENEFYTLTQAYENGYLTKESIADIHAKHNLL